MDVSIIIVNYKTPDLLFACIKSIHERTFGLDYEVIVVDNDSQDHSESLIMQSFPNTKWINNGYNAGFARANNIGIRNSRGEYVLLLNSDTSVQEGFVMQMVEFYKNKDLSYKLGLLCCRIVGCNDKVLQVGSGIGFPGFIEILKANPIYIYFNGKKVSEKRYKPEIMHYKNHEVDYVSGCCAMMRKKKIIENNLFLDEDFFLYSEDIEWSYRIKKNGFLNYFCGEMEVFHENGGSTGFSFAKKAQVQISRYLFYLKTSSKFKYNVIGLFIGLNYRLDIFLNRKYTNKPEIKMLFRQFIIYKQYFFKKIKKYHYTQKDYLKYDKKI